MSKMNNEKLDHLILETWTDFIDLKNKAELSEVLIPNSMPLLWFGDLVKYEKSDLKILTVSKNASYAEFGENQRYEKLLTEFPSVIFYFIFYFFKDIIKNKYITFLRNYRYSVYFKYFI